MKKSHCNSFTYQEHIQLTITFLIILIITTKEIIGNFIAQYPKPKTITLEKPQLQACQKKNAIIEAPRVVSPTTTRVTPAGVTRITPGNSG